MYGVKLIHETQHFLFLFLSAMALIASCRSLPRTDYPILPGHHFMFMWNAPTELCNIHFGMPLDLSYFSFVSSTIRNWGRKDIYREVSTEKVKKKNASLSEDEAEKRAKILFERAAKRYFVWSIQIGKKLRPKRLWGYYLYPYCYNYDYNQDMVGFAGECPDIEKQRNDNLLWLWEESTALFPSIYLELVLKDSRKARLFVCHRIQEVMRVSTLPQSTYSIPIYAYIRPVYKDSVNDYMSEARHHCSRHSIMLPWEAICCALHASLILEWMKGICHPT